jgi:hypothetical protein
LLLAGPETVIAVAQAQSPAIAKLVELPMRDFHAQIMFRSYFRQMFAVLLWPCTKLQVTDNDGKDNCAG